MHLGLRSKPFRRLLCREVPLRISEHLVTYHELLDGGGPQQWREVERVQLPVFPVGTENLASDEKRSSSELQVPES